MPYPNDPRSLLGELLKQLDVADGYAKGENQGRVPSVWQLQNSLLRDKANEVLSSVTSKIT